MWNIRIWMSGIQKRGLHLEVIRIWMLLEMIERLPWKGSGKDFTFPCRAEGVILSWETNILYASWSKNLKI